MLYKPRGLVPRPRARRGLRGLGCIVARRKIGNSRPHGDGHQEIHGPGVSWVVAADGCQLPDGVGLTVEGEDKLLREALEVRLQAAADLAPQVLRGAGLLALVRCDVDGRLEARWRGVCAREGDDVHRRQRVHREGTLLDDPRRLIWRPRRHLPGLRGVGSGAGEQRRPQPRKLHGASLLLDKLRHHLLQLHNALLHDEQRGVLIAGLHLVQLVDQFVVGDLPAARRIQQVKHLVDILHREVREVHDLPEAAALGEAAGELRGVDEARLVDVHLAADGHHLLDMPAVRRLLLLEEPPGVDRRGLHR
mmetsp:Transcript_71909/g.201819  ORF Transcript_71909/g.201819 Transcript_71909/m.201819 type:complete len:306 (-) Transcript_71909:810-1727(-)